MPDDPGFDREPSSGAPTEGVRIINADEAAEVVERANAVKRRGDDEPKFGDRPEPPGGPRPDLRFPLADSSDPGLIVRPRVASVEAGADAPPPPPAAPDVDIDLSSDDDQPVLSVPISGSVELPHWTAPATGEVPRVIVGGDDADEAARWAAFADQGPRWRDQTVDREESAEVGVADLIGEAEDAPSPLGALDTTERPSTQEFLTFDDLDVPQQPLPTVPARGSVDDPIRISSEPSRPSAGGGSQGPGSTPPPGSGPRRAGRSRRRRARVESTSR